MVLVCVQRGYWKNDLGNGRDEKCSSYLSLCHNGGFPVLNVHELDGAKILM